MNKLDSMNFQLAESGNVRLRLTNVMDHSPLIQVIVLLVKENMLFSPLKRNALFNARADIILTQAIHINARCVNQLWRIVYNVLILQILGSVLTVIKVSHLSHHQGNFNLIFEKDNALVISQDMLSKFQLVFSVFLLALSVQDLQLNARNVLRLLE